MCSISHYSSAIMHRMVDSPLVYMDIHGHSMHAHFSTQGPGLYHFRATIVERVSFCYLQTQFTVSVIVHDIICMCVHTCRCMYVLVCIHACICPSMCTPVHLDCMKLAHFMQTFLCVALQQSSPWCSQMNYPTVISHAMSTITCI